MSDPSYYGSWSGYGMPRKPTEPLSAAEAHKRTAYYEAYHDTDGKLVKFIKYLDGSLEWADEYEYWASGTIKLRRLTRPDGSHKLDHFDEQGRRIDDP